jgi:ATP-dependent Zn protease
MENSLVILCFHLTGAKMIRDAFALAREKGAAIIFIDELDAIGTKRFDRCVVQLFSCFLFTFFCFFCVWERAQHSSFLNK